MARTLRWVQSSRLVKLGWVSTENGKREGQRVHIVRQVWYLRAHRCMNAATCRKAVLVTGTEDTKANETMHVGRLLCFGLCRAFFVTICL